MTTRNVLPVVWLLGALSLPAPALEVTITAPPPDGSPLFDSVEVMAEVSSEAAILRVELFVNAVPVAHLSSPPYRFQVDVGADGAAQHFRVVAHDSDGTTAEAEVTSPQLIIHSEMKAELQQIYLTVTDHGGERVVNLGQDRFTVLDEGKPQHIVSFAGGDIPFTAVLLIDASFSMKGNPLAEARAATRTFVQGLRELDEVRVLTFSDRLLSASPVSNQPRQLLGGLDPITVEGGTAINDLLLLALRDVERRHGRRVVILLSDGNDVHSVLGMEQVRAVARRSQAQLYWVSLGEGRSLGPDRMDPGGKSYVAYVDSFRSAAEKEQERRLLARTVRESGGRVVPVTRLADIEPAFADILQELREQFAIGYYPSRDVGDGSWHKVKVRVSGPDLRVRTCTGYLDR